MISSPKPTMSRLSLYFGLALFLILMIHGATIGLTDDEAYYWVLAQKPDWGYAYHPPMVAWLIALSQAALGWLVGANTALVVRFPSALCSAVVFVLGLNWLRAVGVPLEKAKTAAFILLSLAGLFALSWMMVPDIPLFLGWTLSFVMTWAICFRPPSRWHYPLLLASVALAILSKYSGVLIGLSSLICIWIWAPRERKIRASFVLAMGGFLAALPIVIWNAAHEWTSILYQIHDRQAGSLSFLRWARFWAIELFAAGPVLVCWGLFSVRRIRSSKVSAFVWVWAAPAVLVYCLQPLWADFKPHWALIAWWPLALLLAYHVGTSTAEKVSGWVRFQIRYGLALGALVLLACHLPIGNHFVSDPRLDVTNDLYGWEKLRDFLKSRPGNENLQIPVVGSRYQTAAQAYFALGTGAKVTMLPRDLKSRDEWPDLGIANFPGPGWSDLKTKTYFVSDNRYDAPPEFSGARCSIVGRVQEDRAGRPAKWIDVRLCEPSVFH